MSETKVLEPDTKESKPNLITPADESPSGSKGKNKQKMPLFFRTRRASRLFFKDIRSVTQFEILYRVLCMILFFPILVYLERAILYVNFTSNVTANNAVRSMLNPLTWIVLFLIAAAAVFFTLIEQGGFVCAIHAAYSGIKLSTKEILKDGFDYAVDQLSWKNWLVIVYVLVVLPWGSIFDNTSILRFFVVPGFIKEYIDKYPGLPTAVSILGIVMLILNILWVFSFTIMGVEKMKFKDAAKRSRQILKDNGIRDFILILIGYFVYSILSLGVVMGFGFGLWFLLYKWLEPGADYTQIFDMKISAVLYQCLGNFYAWVMIVLFQVVLQDYYYRAMEKEGTQIPEYKKHRHYLDRKPIRILAIAVSAVTIFFSVPARYRQFKWMLNTSAGETMIMAHRGYSEAAPENTLPAFEAAYNAGVSAIELDVQMLKDGTIIVMHDDSFARTCGVNKHVWEVNYDEVKTYDAGKKFSAEFAGTKVPTLDEVIKYCQGKLFINIEIKRNGHDDGIEKAVVDIIRANDFVDYCDVTSQDYHTLELVKEANPDVLTAYTTVIGLGDIENLDAASIISIQETFANFENVERLHRAGKKVFVWTVNDKKAMELLVSLNVDAILTNDPAAGTEVLSAHQGFDDIRRRLESVMRYL